MALVWLVECKTCVQRFAIQRRDSAPGKSTEALVPNPDVGSFECPHCHESHHYSTDEFIPGEKRIAGEVSKSGNRSSEQHQHRSNE